jgi:hypothetical protein
MIFGSRIKKNLQVSERLHSITFLKCFMIMYGPGAEQFRLSLGPTKPPYSVGTRMYIPQG